jgi:hypothetical protein
MYNVIIIAALTSANISSFANSSAGGSNPWQPNKTDNATTSTTEKKATQKPQPKSAMEYYGEMYQKKPTKTSAKDKDKNTAEQSEQAGVMHFYEKTYKKQKQPIKKKWNN